MIYIGADHGGFKLKEKTKKWLGEWGYKYEDCGAFKYDPKDDYPDFAFAVSEKLAEDQGNQGYQGDRGKWEPARVFGILGCRSAAGMVIAANKVKGIRAGAAFDIGSAKHMRKHNDANILAVSGNWLDEKQAKGIIKVFLKTKFTFEKRHIRRLEKITRYVTRKP